jgi:Na+-transporting NADH:ubiquinone oxidoreductase subunit NqrB
MGNFANNQREQQKREERESTAREVLGKTFHDLGKTSFAVMVVGNMMVLLGAEGASLKQYAASVLGVILTFWFIYLGNKIIKHK